MKLLRWLQRLFKKQPAPWCGTDDLARYQRTFYSAQSTMFPIPEDLLGGFIHLGFVWRPQQNCWFEILWREGAVGPWWRRVRLDEGGRIWPYYAAIPFEGTYDPALRSRDPRYTVIAGYRDEQPVNTEPGACRVASGLSKQLSRI